MLIRRSIAPRGQRQSRERHVTYTVTEPHRLKRLVTGRLPLCQPQRQAVPGGRGGTGEEGLTRPHWGQVVTVRVQLTRRGRAERALGGRDRALGGGGTGDGGGEEGGTRHGQMGEMGGGGGVKNVGE